MNQTIAVLNAGSSSIKFALFENKDGDHQLLFRGQIENIGVAPRLSIDDSSGKRVAENAWNAGELDHRSGTMVILQTSIGLLGGNAVEAVGHRVVHGGTRFTRPTLLNEEVVRELKKFEPLAPLHQPHNLLPIETIQRAAPHIPQVACFDTAFHQTQSHVARSFALPRDVTESGVQRYGFHGLSYEYVGGKLREVAPEHADNRIIIAHLGNGASLCAIHHGRTVATTMGFTAVEGLMMGTRCGSIDPGVLLYLMDQRGMDVRAIERLVYKQSGLLGVSGISSDMRTLRESQDPRAREAIELFVYRIVREIGSLAAALGGLDGLVFTGGIGQRDRATRREVAAGCAWLGAKVDEEANARDEGRIDDSSSRLPIWVLPTDEEKVIARSTAAVLADIETSGTGAAVSEAPQPVIHL